MEEDDIQNGWYCPDLGVEVELPESFLITIENMEEACIQADKYARELELAALSMPLNEWIVKND